MVAKVLAQLSRVRFRLCIPAVRIFNVLYSDGCQRQSRENYRRAKRTDTFKIISYALVLYIVSLSTKPVSEHYQYRISL